MSYIKNSKFPFALIVSAVAAISILFTAQYVIAQPTQDPPGGNPVINVTGPAGADGVDGIQGIQGIEGPQGPAGTTIAPSRTWAFGNSINWTCTAGIDIRPECADADGCRIRIIINNIGASSDEVRIIDEHIYMESQFGVNTTNGIYGYTRQGGGGDHSWITGTSAKYTVFNPWGIGHAFTYRHSYCTGVAHASLALGQISFLTRPGWYVIYQLYD